MPAKKHVAPELIAEGKYLYEETLTPTDEIGARMGLSRSAFYLRVKEWNWQRRRYSCGVAGDAMKAIVPVESAAPAAEHAVASGGSGPAVADTAVAEPRAALYARVYRAAQTQVDKIELVQKTLQPTQAAQSERTVRILATLNKALLEIAAMTKPDKGAPPDEADDDAVPRDIDEFRRELARRLKALVDEKSGGSGVGADETSVEPDACRS
jgi:hypothetical protein